MTGMHQLIRNKVAMIRIRQPTRDKVARIRICQPTRNKAAKVSQRQGCNVWKASSQPETRLQLLECPSQPETRLAMFGRHLPTRDKVAMIWRHIQKYKVAMFRMHQLRHLLEFSSQTEDRFLLLVRDTGYTVASRVVLHRGSGAVFLPRDQAAMLNMLQLTRAANHSQFTTIHSR